MDETSIGLGESILAPTNKVKATVGRREYEGFGLHSVQLSGAVICHQKSLSRLLRRFTCLTKNIGRGGFLKQFSLYKSEGANVPIRKRFLINLKEKITMPSYVVKLPAQIDGKTIDWSGARFHDLSVWGGGRGAKDVWGWGGSGECSITDPRPKESSVLVTLDEPPPETDELMAVVARFTLNDGTLGCLGGVLQQSQ